MNRIFPGTFLLVLLALLSPAAATVVLSTDSFTPQPPLVPGVEEQVIATFAIIPSGSTTFAKNHELQMQTSLEGAKWSIQVTQNGRNAAQQNAQGSAAFVNGEILSYTTNNDVGMVVTIDGMVPQGASGQVMLLDLVEIDNSGNVVPGSEIIISQPVAVQSPAGTPSAVPTHTPPVVTTAMQKSPGFTGWTAAAGLFVALAAAIAVRRTG